MRVETGGGKRKEWEKTDRERQEEARAWVREALQEWEEEKPEINLPKPAEHVGGNLPKPAEEYFELSAGSQWEKGLPSYGSPGALNYTEEDGAWLKAQLEQAERDLGRARAKAILDSDPFAKVRQGFEGKLWKQPAPGPDETDPFGEKSAFVPADWEKRTGTLPPSLEIDETDPFGEKVNWEDEIGGLTMARDYFQRQWTDWNNAMYRQEQEQIRQELENSARKDPEFEKKVKEGEESFEELFRIASYGGMGLGMLEDRNAMTEEEKPYYYYYLTKNRDADYKKTLRRKLDERINGEMVRNAEEYASENPIKSGIFSVLSRPFLAGRTALDAGMDWLDSRDSTYKPSANPNTPGQRGLRVNGIYRDASLDALEGNPLGQGALNLVYGAADTVPALLMSSAGVPGLGLAYLSLLEGESAYADAAGRGATNDEAVLSGLGMAAITAALQRAPVKQLTGIFTGDKQEGTKILMDIFFSAKKGAEGSYWEQVAGTVWDEAVMRGKSQVSGLTYQLMEEKQCDWETANRLAKEKFYKSDAMYSAVLGGLSTAVLAAGGHAVKGALDPQKEARARQVYGELLQGEGELALPEQAGTAPRQPSVGRGYGELASGGGTPGGKTGLALPGEGSPAQAGFPQPGQAFFPPASAAGLAPQGVTPGEEFLIPEEAGAEQALSPQQAAGEEAARALTQLLVNEGYFTPEEAAEMLGQNQGGEAGSGIKLPEQDYESMVSPSLPEPLLPEEKNLLYPDWDSGEQEGLSYPDRFKLPGIEDFLSPEARKGLFQLPQEQLLPEEFQRPTGVSDWDWSFRISNAEDAKTDLEKSAQRKIGVRFSCARSPRQ